MNRSQSKVFNRRRIMGVGAALVTSLAAGCGESSRRIAAPTTVPIVMETPGAVPGFAEPEKWKGWTLRIAAAGIAIRPAMLAVVARAFAAATGCMVESKVTDYSELVRSVEDGEPFAEAVVVDPLWAEASHNHDYLMPIRGTPAFERSSFNRLDFDASAIDLFEVDDWSVPAYAYAMVNSYHPPAMAASQEAPDTWQEWWNRRRYPGNRALRKGALGTFEFALLADGVRADELYPLDLARAIESLKRISGKIVDRWWESNQRPIDLLANGSVTYASAWSHRLWLARLNGLAVDWIWNQGLLMTDRWVIPDGVRNKDLVIDFLQYATHPNVQAALAEAAGVGPVTSTAFARIDPLHGLRLPTSPDNLPLLVRANIAWWSEHEVEAERSFNDWLLGVADG